MTRLSRYLARTITLTILLAVGSLVGILTLFTFLEQIQDMQNNYDLAAVGQFVLLSLPRMFYETIPYSALIGCLTGLGILASNSELIVMRAAGVSTWSIAWGAIKPMLILAAIGLWVGEYVLPGFERVARIDREKAISEGGQISSKYGFWYREGNVYMHLDQVEQGGLLLGVNHFYFSEDRQLQKTVYAERAVYHDLGEGESYWLMEKVLITELDGTELEGTELDGDTTRSQQKPSLQWQTKLTPELLSTEILVEPIKMSIGELSDKIAYMKTQGLATGKFELGFWSKVLQPLATMALVFVAISFIFGPLREATMGMRVVSGLIIGIAFKFVQDLVSPASLVYGFPPLIAILIPITICLVAGYALMRRAG